MASVYHRNSVVNVMWFQTIAIIVYISHHVVITGCRYRANMYWWIQNTVSIGLHNMSDQKQASSLLFLFMQVRHLVVVVSYLQEVVVHDLYHESPMDSSTKQNAPLKWLGRGLK